MLPCQSKSISIEACLCAQQRCRRVFAQKPIMEVTKCKQKEKYLIIKLISYTNRFNIKLQYCFRRHFFFSFLPSFLIHFSFHSHFVFSLFFFPMVNSSFSSNTIFYFRSNIFLYTNIIASSYSNEMIFVHT